MIKPIPYDKLQPGDLLATSGIQIKGLSILPRLAQKVFLPHTDRFHFGIIWQETPKAIGIVDWLTLESKGQNWGVHVYRLSDYEGMDIQFFRVSDNISTEGQRALAPWVAVEYASAFYDYLLPFKLLWWVIRAEIHKIKSGEMPGPITCQELARYYNPDEWLACTEMAYRGFVDQEVYVFPEDWPRIPAAYKWALDMGNLIRIE